MDQSLDSIYDELRVRLKGLDYGALRAEPTDGQLFSTQTKLKVEGVIGDDRRHVESTALTVGGRKRRMLNPVYWQITQQDLIDATSIRLFAERNGLSFFGNLSKVPFRASKFSQTIEGIASKIKHGLVIQMADDRFIETGQYHTARVRVDGQSQSLLPGHTYVRMTLVTQADFSFRLDSVAEGLKSKRHTGAESVESLEGHFSDFFKLHVEKGRERDSRYVITPDIMAILVDYFPGCDVEVRDGQLFVVFTPALDYTQPGIMEEMLHHVASLAYSLDKKLYRLAGGNTVSHVIEKPNSVADDKKSRFKVELKAWPFVILIAIFAILLVWAVWESTGR